MVLCVSHLRDYEFLPAHPFRLLVLKQLFVCQFGLAAFFLFKKVLLQQKVRIVSLVHDSTEFAHFNEPGVLFKLQLLGDLMVVMDSQLLLQKSTLDILFLVGIEDSLLEPLQSPLC